MTAPSKIRAGKPRCLHQTRRQGSRGRTKNKDHTHKAWLWSPFLCMLRPSPQITIHEYRSCLLFLARYLLTWYGHLSPSREYVPEDAKPNSRSSLRGPSPSHLLPSPPCSSTRKQKQDTAEPITKRTAKHKAKEHHNIETNTFSP